MVATIVVGFVKYASYCGLIFVDRGIPQSPRKFIDLKNFYAYSKALLLLELPYCASMLLLTSVCKSVAAQYKH